MKIAVAVLIVIAIAGLVLAGLQSRAPAPAPAAVPEATQQSAPPLTLGAPAASAVEDPTPANHILFAPSSDRLSEPATARVQRFAETVVKKSHSVGIVVRFEARANRAEELDLARKRSMAVRQVLEQGGVPLGRMTIEMTELPTGVVSVAEANRVELVLR